MKSRVPSTPTDVHRRGFLVAAASTAAIPLARGTSEALEVRKSAPSDIRALVPVRLQINSHDVPINVDSRTTVLDVLREQLGLTGTKKGCDHGQCGACTIHVDGKATLSCLALAVMYEGRKITTIEGLADEAGLLHPMQQAFIDHDAFQCGYCTSGQIMSAIAVVHEGRAGSENSIREAMSGNLCRCAAYPNIVAAIVQAKSKMGA